MYIITSAIGYMLSILLLLAIVILVMIQSIINNQRLFDPVIKALCRFLPAVFGIKVKVTGMEKIDPAKIYIFMSNHVNIFDGFILYGYIHNFIRGVELEDHFNWPVWGTIVKRMGNIPISHKNPKKALESLEKASNVISEGTSIAILPEGHRTRNGELQAFMRGPFRLAKASKTDIVPIVIKGLWERKSVHSKYVYPGTVEFIVGNPIKVEFYSNLSDRELKRTVRNIFLDMLK